MAVGRGLFGETRVALIRLSDYGDNNMLEVIIVEK